MTRLDQKTGVVDQCAGEPLRRPTFAFDAGALYPGEPVEGGRLSRWAVDGLPGDIKELRIV